MDEKWTKSPSLLILRRDKLLSYIPAVTKGIPSPVMAINDDYLVLRYPSFLIRNLFFIPMLCILLLLSTIEVNDLYNNYLQHNRLDNDVKLSFMHFFIYSYENNIESGTEIYWKGKNKLLFFILSIVVLLIWIIRCKKRAPLIFDYQRKLVYSWIGGVVTAQRYDNIYIHQGVSTLQVQLRAAIDDEHLGWFHFSVIAGGNNRYSLVDAYECILSYIVKFMEHGRQQVMPENVVWSKCKEWCLFEDKKPIDFEEQLSSLLERIDAVND